MSKMSVSKIHQQTQLLSKEGRKASLKPCVRCTHWEGVPVNCIAAVSQTGNHLAQKSLRTSPPSVVVVLLGEILCRRNCSKRAISGLFFVIIVSYVNIMIQDEQG